MRQSALVDELEPATSTRERRDLQPFVEPAAVDNLRGADVATRGLVLQRLQHACGNRAMQRVLAPTVQRQEIPGLDDLPVPEAPGAAVPDGTPIPAGAPAGECPPGYTICDFIDPNISVGGQYALNRLYQRGGDQCHDAVQILSAVRSGQVQGVFKADEGKPAALAQRNGTGWWDLHGHPQSVPQGGEAFVFEGEEPPMVVFKKGIADDREALATALGNAWNASTIGGTEIAVSPPSGRSCDPGTKDEEKPLDCPPGTHADPANPGDCLPDKADCPPGTVPSPADPDICILPNNPKIVTACSDDEVFRQFQTAQDGCAQMKMAIDMLCGLGTDGCDLIQNPIVKNLCKLIDPEAAKNSECKKPRAKFFEDCTVGSTIGEKPNMKCNPGTPPEILEKYRRWPGRITS